MKKIKAFRPITIRCKICGIRITGIELTNGLVKASRQPDGDAPIVDGLCIVHAEPVIRP